MTTRPMTTRTTRHELRQRHSNYLILRAAGFSWWGALVAAWARPVKKRA
jgi:hypothetical protein